ncbi:MAG: hypothetical protein GF335_02630 [Candidatus Moranbacteria bacterium]|nr:hypothetical protein [Candidatus Moranbacteria bacterium]
MAKKTKSTKNESNLGQWVDLIKNWASENAKNITTNFIEETKEGIIEFFENLTSNVNKIIFSSLTVFAGLIFLMVGLSKLINEILMVSGSIGYIFVGLLVIFTGVLIRDNHNRTK